MRFKVAIKKKQSYGCRHTIAKINCQANSFRKQSSEYYVSKFQYTFSTHFSTHSNLREIKSLEEELDNLKSTTRKQKCSQ